jgi:hypothetical protein
MKTDRKRFIGNVLTVQTLKVFSRNGMTLKALRNLPGRLREPVSAGVAAFS